MILVTGATGNTGREIAKELSSRGVAFRCMVRREEAGRQLAAQGFDVVEGDFDRPETLDRALAGAARAYLVCTPDAALAERESRFVAAAASAGIGHVVKLSALLASAEATSPILRSHAAVEQRLADSGLVFTILRPTAFFQTLYAMSHDFVHSQGVMAYPAGDGTVSFLDLRDVAAAACRVLTDDPAEHAGKTYDLTGSESVSFAEMAAALSQALGRPVAYVAAPEEALAGGLAAAGVPAPAAEHVLNMFRLVREGELGFISPAFEQLGIAPATFRDFAADLAAGQTGSAVSFQPPGPPE